MQQCITRLKCTKPHSKDLSIGKVVTIFRFCKSNDESSYGTTGLEVSGMGCVKAADQFIPMDEGEWRKIGVFFQERKGDVGKIIER